MRAFISEQWATQNLTSAKLVGDSFKIKLLIKKKQNKIKSIFSIFNFYFYEEVRTAADRS